jgi:ATP-dependent Clp protease ATP-binding subunit ClpA
LRWLTLENRAVGFQYLISRRKELTDHIESRLDVLVTIVPGAKPTVGFQRVVQRAVLHIDNSGCDEVTGADVVVALFSESESYAVNILRQQGMARLER